MWIENATATTYSVATYMWYSSGGLCANAGAFGVISGAAPYNRWVFLVTTFHYTPNGTSWELACVNADCTNYTFSFGTKIPTDYANYGYSFAIDDNDCCGTIPISGSLADVQLYNVSISQSEINLLYQEGFGGAPISSHGLVGWWPLNGDANDYSGHGNVGYPKSSTSYISTNFTPPSLSSAYEVSAASFPLSLKTSSNTLYNVSVVVWK